LHTLPVRLLIPDNIFEVGAVEVGAVEVGAVEVGAGEVGAVEVGAGEVGAGKKRASDAAKRSKIEAIAVVNNL
jgi:hypothetical protein